MMNPGTLLRIKLIIDAVVSVTSQIIDIVQKIKKQKKSDEREADKADPSVHSDGEGNANSDNGHTEEV
jgi:hypothetical protein